MIKTRKSGVLMHITSLPSPFGIGVMGTSAKKFAEKIKSMGFSIWQVLPLNPPDRFASPYASESAFAGNFMLINPNGLEEMGLITHEEVQKEYYYGSPYTADYEFAYHSRMRVLRSAYSKIDNGLKEQVEKFNSENKWLEEYSLFMAVRASQDGKPWWEWTDGLFDYKKAQTRKAEFSDEQLFWQFVQFVFYKQWKQTKKEINAVGVEILGDMPIYVSMDSADVWANTELFEIDEKTFVPKKVAGVPPDYFSKTGQLWGNPLYDWKEMEKDGYSWWIRRLKHATEIYDMVRIDHFRAFASYWAVPYGSDTAMVGEWLDGPKMKLFDRVKKELGDIPILAEDLGVFGEDVVKLLEDSGFPGMKVIQFGFAPGSNSLHLPHNYPVNSVAYVGTHDNNTILGWLWEANETDRAFALDYCRFKNGNWGEGGQKSESCRSIIEAVWRSSSAYAIISYQDMSGYGADARMNTPGKAEGNWLFRTTNEAIDRIDSEYFKKINYLFSRN